MTETTAVPALRPLADPHNQFPTGPFASISPEITTVDLHVIGTLPPAELNARLPRIGPNCVSDFDPLGNNQ